jgi:hypothetical protein
MKPLTAGELGSEKVQFHRDGSQQVDQLKAGVLVVHALTPVISR